MKYTNDSQKEWEFPQLFGEKIIRGFLIIKKRQRFKLARSSIFSDQEIQKLPNEDIK